MTKDLVEREQEFDCIECGRHIIRLAAPPNQPKFCAECLMIPGWHTDPKLRKILDPDYEREDD
jgi:hypothetical protein